ncbi:MAG: PhoH family protein [Bacteroidales bacterium]|nr:PhoH family protein [Bacteroidales bacterium]
MAERRKTTSTKTKTTRTRQKSKTISGLERVIKVKTRKPKIFVLDTNVLLHDWRCIFKFQENDLVIPLAVIEELDKFKKGDGTINYNAREFVRKADEIFELRLYDPEKGYPLGPGLGTIKISVNRPFPEDLADCFTSDVPDHRILATAIWYRNQYPDRTVCLVTKDVNLRLKAKALGMFTQDYLNDHIKEEKFTQDYDRVIQLANVPEETINALMDGEGVDYKDLYIKAKPAFNQLYRIPTRHIDIDTNEGEYEYLNMGGEDRDPIRDNIILGRFDARTGKVVRVLPLTQYGISPRNEEQVFAMDAVMNKDVELVSLTGTAGTGKTLLAVAGALAQADYYEQILVARPVITLQNEEMGFLPGDVQEKLAPFMQPLYDNIAVIKKNFGPSAKENIKIEEMLRTKKLEIAPLAYIRGRSLQKTFFIIDEAQNLTPHEVKTIITRAGEGTKIVFTGDVQQIDQPYLDKYSNGLTHISDKLYGEKLFEHVNLIMGERSALSELAGKKL